MPRDPWDTDHNPRQTLYAAVLIVLEDAPSGAIPDEQLAEKPLEVLYALMTPSQLTTIRQAISKYVKGRICEVCEVQHRRLYRWKGMEICGRCRARMAARERWQTD